MHSAHTRLLGIIGSLVILTGCGTVPTAPTPIVATGALLVADASQEVASPARSCGPSFSSTPDGKDPTFVVVTIHAPAGCQWFAHDVEEDGNYWDLTSPDYSLRNRLKYPDGVAGAGTQQLGVHFLKKIGYRDHLTFELEVCAGTSCSPTARRWTWTYIVPVS